MGLRLNRSLVPKSIRVGLHPITRRIRQPALVSTIRTIADASDTRVPTDDELRRMCLKWSNSDSVAELPVLAEVAAKCRDADGPVLECGSGVTTFVAAAYARHGCWSLENHETYRRRVVDVLERAGLPCRVFHAPLIGYNGFDWYQIPDGLPDRFALVICDGPRAATRGGRTGLLPVMQRHLAGATVILDDSQREGEQAAMRMWADQFHVSVVGNVGSATILHVPSQVR